jgi:hypothetical protein
LITGEERECRKQQGAGYGGKIFEIHEYLDSELVTAVLK